MPDVDGSPLGEYLQIRPPQSVEKTQVTFTFVRERTVPVDWEAVSNAAFSPDHPFQSHSIQSFVRAGRKDDDFTLEKGEAEGWIILLGENVSAYVARPSSIQRYKTAPTTGKADVRDRKIPEATAPDIISDGIVVRVTTKRRQFRYYLLLDEHGDRLNSKWLELNGWKKMWEAVKELQPVAMTDPASPSTTGLDLVKTFFSFTEMVRADAVLIETKYKALKLERELGAAYYAQAIALLKTIETAEADEMAALRDRYYELVSYYRQAEERMRRLKDAAVGLGYVLVTEDSEQNTNIWTEDGAQVAVTLEKGKLYLVRPKTVTWTTRHKEHNGRDFWGRRKYKWRTEVHHKSFKVYEKADPDADPWFEVLDFYAANGYETFLFEVGDSGELTADGVALRDLVQQLIDDEDFRLKTVVALPVTEKSILGDELLVGYLVVGRPMPELFRTEVPRIYAFDHMTYQFSWTGTSLGELVTTIPLAPGEEREVTISTSSFFEDRSTDTRSSLVDILRVDKQDFESFFEKEIRKENETKETLSAEVNGSYGAASGSAKFAKEKRVSEIQRTLNRTVQKASQSLSQQQKVETRSERVRTERSEQSNRVTYKVRNINEAATLNVMLYKVKNDFDARCANTRTTFAVETGRALLEGSEIYHRERFEGDTIDALVDILLDEYGLPATPGEATPIERRIMGNSLQTAIAKASIEAFPRSQDDKSLTGLAEESAILGLDFAETTPDFVTAEHALEQTLAVYAGYRETAWSAPEEQSRIAALAGFDAKVMRAERERVESFKFESIESFSIDSGGLYADVVMGQKAATDQYAVDRRELEKRRIGSEIELNEARAKWLLSRVKPASTSAG